MDKLQERLTDKEMESLQNIVSSTLANICAMADKHNIDRDSMLKYFADMLTVFAEVASIQNYKTSRTCNCKHNHNSNSDEPCCRCDNRKTNADRIRSMSDEELAKFLAFNAYCEECYVAKDDCCCLPDGSCKQKHLEWLQSPVDDEVSDLENFEVRR